MAKEWWENLTAAEMAEVSECSDLLDTFETFACFVDLLRLSDDDLAAVGIPQSGRRKLSRARERIRALGLQKLVTGAPIDVPTGVPKPMRSACVTLHVLGEALDFDKKLKPAFQKGGTDAVIAALLEEPDRPS